jgi:valyl-tRNA synthetase
MALNEIKSWNNDLEQEITDKWKSAELFKFDNDSPKKIYSIDTPPPYVNAPIHIGQAVTYCYMDFFARYKRMKDFQVIFPLGLDNNGLPIEMGAEKKFKVSALHMDRDEFIALCKKLLSEAGTATKDTFAKLGISFSTYKEDGSVGSVYQTDSPEYRKITQATFLDLWRKGMIYEDKRINNWDPKLRTTIADSEIEYKEIPSTFNDVKWKVKNSDEEIIIATTRPELICSCGMVIFHPTDKRYKHLDGKKVVSPIFGKEILIKSHPMADPEKGSGIVMMCSAGDLSDIQFFREEGIDTIISINIDGTMNENAGEYKGLRVKEAREKIIEDLKTGGLLLKQEKITHRTPVSERSGAEIEFIEMSEFYLKQVDNLGMMRKLADKIDFYPEFARKTLHNWIDSVSIDWPISRRRFYATPIPVWTAEKDEKIYFAVPKEFRYYEPWKESVPTDSEVYFDSKKIGEIKNFSDLDWKGETKVMDTWMDSSISELAMLKYKTDDKFFKKAYPASLRPQGKEIIRTWLYYTMLRGYLETGKLCFDDAWINQHIVDAKGYKMSKSKGNVIDPLMLLEKYGGEAIRFWAATEGDLAKQDLKCSEDRISGEKKTLNKLLNVSKFVMMFDKPEKKPEITKTDNLFINYIEGLTRDVDESYEKYDFYKPAQKLRRFLWEVFASNYVELVKGRAYNTDGKFSDEESNSAKWSLHYILERFLHLVYPIIPQITTLIGKEKGLDLLTVKWPHVEGKPNLKRDSEIIEKVLEFNSMVWKKKKDEGISLRDEISGIEIPKELLDFENDLKNCHGLK